LPKISDIEISTNKKCRMLVLNYPNNPTGAVANREFYSEIIEFCKAHEIVVYNDGAYNEIIDSGQNPLSILQCDKEKYSVEFGTFSKTYNMTGFRIGYAVGNAHIIKALLKIKSNVDSGQFIPIQQAAVAAMNLGRSYVNQIKETYFDRKKCVENLLLEREVKFFSGHGTFYIWGSVPKGYTSAEFCEELLDNYGVVVTPGTAFDSNDSIHFRISLTKCKEELINSISRLKKY
jgi:LL-diaminopimelate aminotransferase